MSRFVIFMCIAIIEQPSESNNFKVSLPESKFQVPQAYTLDPYR